MISIHDEDGTVLKVYALEPSGKVPQGTFKRQKRRMLVHPFPKPNVVVWHASDTSEDPNLSSPDSGCGRDSEFLNLCPPDTWLATTLHDDPGETFFHGVDMEGGS